METRNKSRLLKKLGIFTLAEAKAAGFSQPTISRLASKEEIIRLETGIYRHTDAKVDFEHLDFIIASKRFGPDVVIGLMSAIVYHGLIEQIPEQIWILVPPGFKTTTRLYRCIRTKSNLKMGIDRQGHFAITNIERTIAEAFKFSTKVGLDIAIRAARTALKTKKTTAVKILKQAKALKIEQFVLRHWEAITID